MTYLVVGCGKSGIAASELLLQKNQEVLLYDSNQELDKEAFLQKNPSLKNVDLQVGEQSDEFFSRAKVAVLSPGVPTDLPLVEHLKELGLSIIGEVELAYKMGAGRVLAITGTNGKTTTTSLCGEILKANYSDARVVGNIGIPYTTEALTMTEDTVVAAEISSFQLETTVEFHPAVSAILNITPDHLNRHHTMEAYIQAKEDITKAQTSSDVCVLNYEDEVLRKFGETCVPKVVYFSSARKLNNGYYYEDGAIYKATDGVPECLVQTSDLHLLGLHNFENIMAAMACCEAFGVPMDVILKVVRDFEGVEHRIEFVAKKGGVSYYNDSKGTNPDAAIKGISAMPGKTCLIGGGYDKESEYDEWIQAFQGKVKLLVLIGQTREKIADCAKKHGFTDYVFADSLEEAVKLCKEHALPGEYVLLSPACASWGMFDNYEERGRIFKQLVHEMED